MTINRVGRGAAPGHGEQTESVVICLLSKGRRFETKMIAYHNVSLVNIHSGLLDI